MGCGVRTLRRPASQDGGSRGAATPCVADRQPDDPRKQQRRVRPQPRSVPLAHHPGDAVVRRARRDSWARHSERQAAQVLTGAFRARRSPSWGYAWGAACVCTATEPVRVMAPLLTVAVGQRITSRDGSPASWMSLRGVAVACRDRSGDRRGDPVAVQLQEVVYSGLEAPLRADHEPSSSLESAEAAVEFFGANTSSTVALRCL
jgi:hypothetical protein